MIVIRHGFNISFVGEIPESTKPTIGNFSFGSFNARLLLAAFTECCLMGQKFIKLLMLFNPIKSDASSNISFVFEFFACNLQYL